jgi:hypothetical protein
MEKKLSAICGLPIDGPQFSDAPSRSLERTTQRRHHVRDRDEYCDPVSWRLDARSVEPARLPVRRPGFGWHGAPSPGKSRASLAPRQIARAKDQAGAPRPRNGAGLVATFELTRVVTSMLVGVQANRSSDRCVNGGAVLRDCGDCGGAASLRAAGLDPTTPLRGGIAGPRLLASAMGEPQRPHRRYPDLQRQPCHTHCFVRPSADR